MWGYYLIICLKLLVHFIEKINGYFNSTRLVNKIKLSSKSIIDEQIQKKLYVCSKIIFNTFTFF